MAKEKEEKIFCVYCGTENSLVLKKCSKCGKELDPKNRPFRDYLKEKVEDKLKGDVQDEMLTIMINFIKTHLYGSILTCSIIITAISVVTNVVNNSNEFEEVTERPVIVNKLDYLGEGLTAEEVTNKYLDALNKNDVDTLKSLELNTFHSEVLKKLKGKESVPISDMYGTTIFLDTKYINENRNILFGMENSYLIGQSFGVVPEGKYGDYEFRRYPIFFNYCYENKCDIDNNTFNLSIAIELIKVDNNYYISGSELEVPMDIGQEMSIKFLFDNKGDVSKFSKQDVDNYILSLS